ncbi:MAG: ribosome assembly factor SBDS [Nanoarchaeota archaeon]|nr:ribosome assembly factor SBDS [Nanoarchaeota archaeon]MBU0962394.1 ribosome assembly factor SBDS [Nanoarchaeota archaeon]
MDVDKAVIARLKKEGKNFEILVDGDSAIKFNEENSSVSIDDVLVTDDIFSDVKKGTHASEADLKNLFKTINKKDVAKIIIKDGDIQITTEHKNKIIEEKRKRIINFIHRNAIDSKTGLPHPLQRIENAMNEAKVNVTYTKSVESQVQDVIKLLRPLIPIKFEVRELSIKIQPQFIGGAFHILKSFGKLLKEDYSNDGSLIAVLEIPAGIQEELFDKLNGLTHGQVIIDIINKK